MLTQQARARGAAEDSMPLAQLAALQQRQTARRSERTAKREQVGLADRPDSAEVQPGLQRAAQQGQAGHKPQHGDLQEPGLASRQSSGGVGPAPALLPGGALTGIEVPGSSMAHAAAALPPQIPPSQQTRLGDRVLSAPPAAGAQLPDLAQLQAGSPRGAPPGPAPLQQKHQGLGSLQFGQAQHRQGQQPPVASAAPPLPFSAWAPASQETLNHPDNMGDIYVECDLCKKWRHLPQGHQVGSSACLKAACAPHQFGCCCPRLAYPPAGQTSGKDPAAMAVSQRGKEAPAGRSQWLVVKTAAVCRW